MERGRTEGGGVGREGMIEERGKGRVGGGDRKKCRPEMWRVRTFNGGGGHGKG